MKFNHKDIVRIGGMSKETGAQIDALKVEARKYYQSYNALLDSRAPSCGRNLSEHMIPGLGELKEKFNTTMDKLAALDPTCPDTRL